MSIWFTSDTHFGHANIIKYCKRPFLFDSTLVPKRLYDSRNLDVETMDETLIGNWNSVVAPNDMVYHIGDFAFYKDQRKTMNVLRRLNGNKVLIEGNHDRGMERAVRSMFSSVHQYLEINVPDADVPRGGQMIVLMHYSMNVWNKSHHGAWQLFGHSHGTLADVPNSLSIDVGSDCFDLTPISYDQVKKIMSKKTWKPIDHHGDK